MREAILKDIFCPFCQSSYFKLDILLKNETEIRDGSITCLNCRRSFKIEKGTINLIGEFSDSGRLEVEEIDKRIREDKLEEFMNKEWLLRFPENEFLGLNNYRDDVVRKSAENAISFLHKYQLSSDLKILEIGSGNCWLTARLAENHNIVALDVLSTPPLGLATADIFIKEKGVFFERVLSDMSSLPFKNESFDVVIFNSALHHTPDLTRTLLEARRILRPSGRVILLGEPVTGIIPGPKRRWVRSEKEIGINENEINIKLWTTAFRKSFFLKFNVLFPANLDKVFKSRGLLHRIIGYLLCKTRPLSDHLTIPVLFLFDGFFNAVLYKE